MIAAGLLVIVVVLAAFMSSSRGVVPVRAERAVRLTIMKTIQTNEKVETVQNFEAHAPAASTVKKILALEGDHVKQGQLLLQLDDGDARTQAAKALAQVRASEADLAAVKGGGTHQEVLSTEAQLVKARGQVENAQRNLEALKRLQTTGAASPAEVEAGENQLRSAQAELNLAN